MKQCPQCNRTYDDSWGICLYDESKLTIFKEQTLSRIENKEHTSNHVPLIVRSTSSTRSSTRIESVTKKPSRKIKVKEDGLRRGLMKNKAKTAEGAKRNNSLESATGAGLPSDFKLSEEFKRGFDAIEDTRKNLYITGEAGTGKTTLLQYFRKQSKRNYVILAPTGIAAINSHGQTIHSFFKFPPKLIQKSDIKRAYNAKQIFSKLDLVIIDEASMMRADILDGIDYSLRLNKGNMDVPFGGIQIVLFGDLYQLPPIVTKELALFYERLYDSPYFFSAHVFGSVEFNSMELKTNYRQRDNKFVELLNKIRNRCFESDDISPLHARVCPTTCDSMDDCITLVPTNRAANVINESRLSRLKSKEFVYNAVIKGEFDESSYPTETELSLKAGGQVLMIKNDQEKRWVNGSIGEVVELDDDMIRIRIRKRVHSVGKVTWKKIRYRFDEHEDKIIEDAVGSFEQYPIKLAWAITIHKSQGLTFDKVIVDFDTGTFAHGQAYVALSRCRSLDGLFLKQPIAYSDIIFDERIQQVEDLIPELH